MVKYNKDIMPSIKECFAALGWMSQTHLQQFNLKNNSKVLFDNTGKLVV